MPLIKPLARYFSIPSRDVGGLHLRNVALNCSPCSLSCTQLPRAVIHSPALMLARAPTTVTSSRWPFTFTRSTAAQIKELWLYAGEDELPPDSLLQAQVEALRILH